MTIKQEIKLEMIQAMRSGDKNTLSTTKLILSEFDRNAKDIPDEQALKILGKLAKSEREMMEITKVDHSDLLTMIQKYTPKPATDEEIVTWVLENVDFEKLKNPKQAIGMVNKHFGAKVSGMGGKIWQLIEKAIEGKNKND